MTRRKLMQNISTKNHAFVSFGVFPDNAQSGTIIVNCVGCGKTAIGGYGKKYPDQNKGRDLLEIELDTHECVPFGKSMDIKNKVLVQSV